MVFKGTRLEQVLAQIGQQLALQLAEREARLEAEILLAASLNKSRVWLKTWPDYQLSPEELLSSSELLERRVKGEPLAYILGFQEFWSLKLAVNEHTLIPRPETELLVELALDKIPLATSFKLADLGTGSGAIALAIASERAQATVFAVDFSGGALQVAQANRQRLKLENVEIIQNSWLDNWSHGSLDLIVSNPPYVATGDPHLADLSFEPNSALVAADMGYADILTIARQAKTVLKAGGFLMFEHGYEQAEKVRSLLAELDYDAIQTYQDLSHLDRVTVAQNKDSLPIG